MGEPADPREMSLEEERILAWDERHGLDLPGNAGMDLMDLVADMQKRAYDQGFSDGQRAPRSIEGKVGE